MCLVQQYPSSSYVHIFAPPDGRENMCVHPQMYMSMGNWGQAYNEFYEGFRNYQEAGNPNAKVGAGARRAEREASVMR